MRDGPTRVRASREDESTPSPSCLLFLEGEPALVGRSLALDGELVLGRDPGCDVLLDADDVSRRHARIAPDAGGHVVADLGSTNGTWVNGEEVEARRLAPGDLVRVGSVVAKYLRASDPEARGVEELRRRAAEDPLTGLPNRRAFEEALAREVARARRSGAALGLVTLDVDHFKRVNDVHGHAAGDSVLRVVARRMASVAREGDLVARIGGEEFAAVLPGADLDATAEAAERIRAKVGEASVDVSSAKLAVTVSAGAAVLAPGEDGAALQARADARLYDAKRTGRDRVAR
jgi:diguanylate cyclase (GGDEF)-like protein